MTVVRFSNNRYEGLTADTKPTTAPAGAIYRDTQLDIEYEFNGSSWDVISKTTGTIRETLGYGFTGTVVRTASSIKLNGDITANGQGVFGHALGVTFNVKRVRIIPSANAKTGTTTVRLYRDSTQVNSWDITAGSTTEIDTGAVTYAYTSSEKIDIVYDSNAGGAALSITLAVYVDIEKTVSLT